MLLCSETSSGLAHPDVDKLNYYLHITSIYPVPRYYDTGQTGGTSRRTLEIFRVRYLLFHVNFKVEGGNSNYYRPYGKKEGKASMLLKYDEGRIISQNYSPGELITAKLSMNP